MSISLPQHDPNRQQRSHEIEQARSEYQFDYAYYGMGFIDKVPLDQEYDLSCIKTLTEKTLGYLSARASNTVGEVEAHVSESLRHAAERFVGALCGRTPPSADTGSESTAAPTQTVRERVAQYLAMFADESLQKQSTWDQVSLPFTDAWKHWDEDWYFAYQAVAGIVPTFIRRIDAPLANFVVSDETYQRVTGDSKTLAEAIAEKRVFVWDFALFDGLPGSSKFGFDKLPVAALVMFAWNDTEETGGFGLRPVAIQCGQDTDAPQFTPEDGYRWKMARLCAQAAIGGVSGCSIHFGVHLILERCIIASHRTLSTRHPILHLLTPNYRFTLPTNRGLKLFTLPEMFIPDLLAPPREVTMVQLADVYVQNFRFDRSTPPALFAAQGLDDPSVLPIYPFREDTTRVWQAIATFVGAYIGAYYQSDDDVANDWEVQAWVEVLQSNSDQGARLHGIGVEGKVQTIAALSDLVAQILYLASAFHAALSFSGLENLSFPLVVSFAGVAPPSATTPNTEAEFVARMPPMHYAWKQFFLVWFQSMLWESMLGDYPHDHFEHPAVREAVADFQAKLRLIEAEIDAVNERRPLPYYWQRPGAITSSIQG